MEDVIIVINVSFHSYYFAGSENLSVGGINRLPGNPDNIENRVTRETLEFPMSLMKHYKKKLTAQEYLICRYKLCYQITGSLRLFFDWFINDMPLPVENIVTMLNAMNVPKTIQYRNIPSIIVRLKGE